MKKKPCKTEDSPELKPGDEVEYISYEVKRRGIISHIGASGIIFLKSGGFLFPQSILK